MFISLDLETTGFDPTNDRIIEFGAIKFDLKGNTETLQILINPTIPIPEIVTHITNIKDSDVQNAPLFEDKMEEIANFIGDLPIIGHNIQFDTGFLRANGIELTNPEFDTCQIASSLIPGLPSYSLEILSKIFDLQHEEKHRALDDAIAAMELFLKLLKTFESLPEDTLKEIQTLVEKSDWPLKELIKSLSSKNHSTALQKNNNSTPPTKIEITEDLSKLLETNYSGLFEIAPPYESLITTLSEKILADSNIVLPTPLFREVEQHLPDNIAKIDLPENFISLTRLEEFKKQAHFSNDEISALIKYIIWLNSTKTGLLSEIKLFSDERQTLSRVNIDETNDLEKEKFYQKALKKDINSPAICTHDYFIESETEFSDVILFDLHSLANSLHFRRSAYIKLEHLTSTLSEIGKLHPGSPTIESLTLKSEMLFGMLSLFFNGNNDQNPYAARAWIDNKRLSSQEWSKIKEMLQHIIELSSELGDFTTPETLPSLKKWKKTLVELNTCLKTPNLSEQILWLENYNEETIIRLCPIFLEKELKEVLKKTKNLKIIDENLDLNDKAEFIKAHFDMDQELALHKISTGMENLNIFVTEDMPDKPGDTTPHKYIADYLIKHRGNTAIVSNSRANLSELTLYLSKRLKGENLNIISQLTGSLGKLEEMYKSDPENSVLIITPYFWEKFKENTAIERLIIQKIPFDPPSDPYILSASHKYQNAFMDFQIPSATLKLKKLINRLDLSDKTKNKEMVILDSRLIHKRYGKTIMDILSNTAHTETISIQSRLF